MNAQVVNETPRRRGRPPSKVVAPPKRANRKGSAAQHKDDYVFEVKEFESLGQEMAVAATQQTVAASTYWDKCRSLFVQAQDHGRAADAIVALFAPGEAVKGKKAPWYRTYKSILTQCEQRGLHITNEHGVTAAQALIKESKANEIEADPAAKKLKDAQMIDMFRRLAQGCLNRGIKLATLNNVMRELAAA